jgi:hypothetical protein
MPNDLLDQVQRIVEWVTGLGFLLPVAVFVLVQLFNRDKAETTPDDSTTKRTGSGPSTTAPTSSAPPTGQPVPAPGMPWGLPTWMGMEGPVTSPAPQPASTSAPTSQWGHNFDREEVADGWGQASDWGHGYDQASDADDQVLRWGSAFENDAEGEPIRWTSTFDEEGQQNVYGWEGATWGGTFPPRSSEPVIHVG